MCGDHFQGRAANGARSLPGSYRGVPLEEEPCAVRNGAARIGAVEDAEARRVAQTVSADIRKVIVRHREVRVVEGVEELNADLHLQALGQCGVLEEREIG